MNQDLFCCGFAVSEDGDELKEVIYFPAQRAAWSRQTQNEDNLTPVQRPDRHVRDALNSSHSYVEFGGVRCKHEDDVFQSSVLKSLSGVNPWLFWSCKLQQFKPRLFFSFFFFLWQAPVKAVLVSCSVHCCGPDINTSAAVGLLPAWWTHSTILENRSSRTFSYSQGRLEQKKNNNNFGGKQSGLHLAEQREDFGECLTGKKEQSG